jgi:hypothetical protein
MLRAYLAGMNALTRPIAIAAVCALAGGAVGYSAALIALRGVGPVYAILLCAPPFAVRGWRLGAEIAGGNGGGLGAKIACFGGLVTGGFMGIFFGGWAQLIQFHSPYPVAAVPLTILCAVRGFWWGFEARRRREAWRV